MNRKDVEIIRLMAEAEARFAALKGNMDDRRLYPDSLAAKIKQRGGGLYRPSNGTEGEMFHERWCYNCLKLGTSDGDQYPVPVPPCAILDDAFFYDIDDENYPKEWCYDAEGQPQCTAFEKTEDDDATLR